MHLLVRHELTFPLDACHPISVELSRRSWNVSLVHPSLRDAKLQLEILANSALTHAESVYGHCEVRWCAVS